jgi:hypothetical protein
MGDPLVSLWKFTFCAREPEYSFGQVFRKSVITDLESLADWLFEKFRKPTLPELRKGVTPAAAPLIDQAYREGGFHLTFLKEIKQNGLLLGKFVNLTGYVMWFDRSDQCWKTEAPRAFRLELVCNDETSSWWRLSRRHAYTRRYLPPPGVQVQLHAHSRHRRLRIENVGADGRAL